MSWADKALKKHKIEKAVVEVMSTPEYKEIRRDEREQDVLRAFVNFCFITLDFLELRHGYKHNGLEKFLEFAIDRMGYTERNEAYFLEMNQYYKNTFGLDVLKNTGLAIQLDGEENART